MLSEVATVQAPQDRETPATVATRAGFAYRYAYARSDDSRRAGDHGQDYLAVRDDGRRFAFVLCDGVSQSFMGDLAARILGDALLDWLWERNVWAGAADVAAALAGELAVLVERASREVAAYRLPDELPEIVRAVLEQKRALGSESTFVCGALDPGAAGAVFAWMGDCRLRLWGDDGERTTDLGDTFHTRERWSTRLGCVGQPHVWVGDARTVRRLIAYTDGFAPAASAVAVAPSAAALDGLLRELGELPASDDISYLEWWPGPLPALDGTATLPRSFAEVAPVPVTPERATPVAFRASPGATAGVVGSDRAAARGRLARLAAMAGLVLAVLLVLFLVLVWG